MIVAAALASFVLDRLTKHAAARLGVRAIALGPIARICYRPSTRRVGASRGDRAVLILLWCAALGCAILLHRTVGQFRGDVATVGLGAAFGGAAGNLFDMVRREPIVDFIDLRWWPVFNLADVAIVGGLLVAFVASR